MHSHSHGAGEELYAARPHPEPVVLDIGAMRRADRERIRQIAEASGLSLQWHFVDAPQAIRRARVAGRNTSKGETFVREVPPEMFDKSLIADLRVVAETRIEAKAAELRAAGVETITSVRLGFIDDSIAHHAGKTNAELLVMGTHARSAAARLFLGSVAERTIRSAPRPTLVVPPNPLSRLARGKPFSGPLRVTAGIDLSLASDSALAWLKAFGLRFPCDLRFVHLYWPPREHELLGFGPSVAFEDEPEVVEVLSRGLRAHLLAELGRDDLPLRVRQIWGDEQNPLAWEALKRAVAGAAGSSP